ncbi:MAG: MoxR family ATPase [Termitinemataceae bacterium]|nr:MAG: MoxR family ATPase [Termitinemataceae bacterium]
MERNISEQIHLSADDLIRAKEIVEGYRREMAKMIVAQKDMVDGLLMALIAGGHILLEGAPGLAKTLAVKSLAAITGLEFKRIQFTPDLLPADLTGTLVWEPSSGTFSVRKGPVFTNLVLADEINRAPAKVQSALLEAMEEYQVTIGDNTWQLSDPFFVLATQNPIEQEGTYPLPEAQLDRFLLKLLISYPSLDDEINILKINEGLSGIRQGTKNPPVEKILSTAKMESLKKYADGVHVDENIERYMVSIVAATRPSASANMGKMSLPSDSSPLKAGKEGIYRYIGWGASPRASIALHHCSKICALFAGNAFVRPEDVKKAAYPVLRHRLVLSYEAEADALDADAIISRILSSVPVP